MHVSPSRSEEARRKRTRQLCHRSQARYESGPCLNGASDSSAAIVGNGYSPLLMNGVFPCAVITLCTVCTNSLSASVTVILRSARLVCVSSSSSQHGRLTSSPPELIIVPGSVDATESKNVRTNASVDGEAMRSWPAGGSEAYLDQGDLAGQAICSGYAALIAVVCPGESSSYDGVASGEDATSRRGKYHHYLYPSLAHEISRYLRTRMTKIHEPRLHISLSVGRHSVYISRW